MASEQSSQRERLADPENWVDAHGDVLFRYALARVANAEVAEELVQETFLAALSAQQGFGGRSTERTWLIGILKHKIVDYFRRKTREPTAPDADAPGDLVEELFDQRGRWHVKPAQWAGDPQRLLEQQEFWEAFRRCLSQLPERQAAAFSLREMEDLSGEEICKILGVTATNLWVLLHRARMGLWRCLDANWFRADTEKA